MLYARICPFFSLRFFSLSLSLPRSFVSHFSHKYYPLGSLKCVRWQYILSDRTRKIKCGEVISHYESVSDSSQASSRSLDLQVCGAFSPFDFIWCFFFVCVPALARRNRFRFILNCCLGCFSNASLLSRVKSTKERYN